MSAKPETADVRELWQRVRDAVRLRIGEPNFEAWIAPLRASWTPEALELEALDPLTRDRVARHFLTVVEQEMRALGVERAVRITVAAALAPLPIRVVPPVARHTFATFVVGHSNETAHRAAHALVERGHGPVFLHGPSGVGKTHLLHATCHELLAHGVAAACLPAADLVAALVASCATGDASAFWTALTPLQALLLDDVHSLAGQEEVQDLVMDGLAGWMAGGRLLALSSDRPPADVARLTAAVRTHVAGGIVAAIDRPEPALRVAILERKAESWGLPIDLELATRIAGAIGGNVRRLEGALTRLVAHARLFDRQIDGALAADVLPELRARPEPPLTITGVVQATATVFGVRARMLIGRSRRPELVVPRQVAMYLARRLLQRSFADIAAEFARDHTTVLQACRRVTARLGVDEALTRLVTDVERRLRTRGT